MKPSINNRFYDELGERWLNAQDDPVALLRAEGLCKQAWVKMRLPQGPMLRILDIGCGAGFLTRYLSELGHHVIGLDLSYGSLAVAKNCIPAQVKKNPKLLSPVYLRADAYRLPFDNGVFDCITCMDFLEHVENPAEVIAEASRVLRPGGHLFLHTFNRNILAKWVIIKGVEWFVKNTPPQMHVLPLFIKPKELAEYCQQAAIDIKVWTGIRPVLNSAFFKMLLTRTVPKGFRFTLTPSLKLSYLGLGIKRSDSSNHIAA